MLPTAGTVAALTAAPTERPIDARRVGTPDRWAARARRNFSAARWAVIFRPAGSDGVGAAGEPADRRRRGRDVPSVHLVVDVRHGHLVGGELGHDEIARAVTGQRDRGPARRTIDSRAGGHAQGERPGRAARIESDPA